MRMRIPSLYVTTRNYIQCYHDWCKSCDKVRYRNNGFLELVCVCGTDAAVRGTAFVRYRYALLTGVANAKINLRYSLYTRYQWWSSCSDSTNTVRSRSHERRRGSAT